MSDKDSRRRFTSVQKLQLFVSAAGICSKCGNPLEQGWHGHHKVHHAKGGPTVLDNGNALCPKCHMREHQTMTLEDEINRFGAFRKDYSWQENSVETFMLSDDIFYSRIPGRFLRAYLNEVSPSGGKSVFSMKLLRRLITEGMVDKGIWCVPRDSIKLGFMDDARLVEMPESAQLIGSKYIRVDTDLDSGYEGLLRNYHGVVITYQSLPKRLDYFELLSAKYRLMFFFDEAHHGSTGDEDEAMNVWGAAMERCRSFANAVVCMTGTPLRSDAKKVQFVEYEEFKTEDGATGFKVKPDFSFSYARAVTAGVARKLVCRSQDPEITYAVTNHEGSIEQHCLPVSAIPYHHLTQVKNTAFCFDRGVVDDMLKLAHEECERLRSTDDSDAGILVIGRRDKGEDNDSLAKIKERIESLFNEEAVTVESADGPIARNAIRKFKYGTERWIVAKEMISEGTNLPRLRIIVILRDIGNRTFYEQLVHRITRNDADDRPQEAIIIQLQLKHLHEWGMDLEKQALIGWKKREDDLWVPCKNCGTLLDYWPSYLRPCSECGWAPPPKPKTHKRIEGIFAELESETIIMEGEDFTDVDPIGRKLHALIGGRTKTSRWQLNIVVRSLVELGVSINPLSGIEPDKDDLFSKEEQFNRHYDRGIKWCQAAGVNLGGERETFARIVAECKRSAGISCRLQDVIRDHPNPIEAIKAFEQAAHRAMQRSRPKGDAE